MEVRDLNFSNAGVLCASITSLFDPEKSCSPGSALRCMQIVQGDSIARITSYIVGRGWYQLCVPCEGIEGTTYLFDPEEFISRVAQNDVWKKNPVVISDGKLQNSITVKCVRTVDPNTKELELIGSIRVSHFSGDLGAFEIPEWEGEELSILDNTQVFAAGLKHLISFSVLKTDTANRAIWFSFSKAENRLDIYVTERGSNRGIAMARVSIKEQIYINRDFSFGILGRHASKLLRLCSGNAALTLSIDYSATPNLVKFSTRHGYLELPSIESYYCQALSRGAPTLFYGTDCQTRAVRRLNADDLYAGLVIQTPKKGASANDVVIKQGVDNESTSIVVFKRTDYTEIERSLIPVVNIEDLSEHWTNLVADHSYLSDSIKFISSMQEQLKREDGDYLQDTDEEYDEWDFVPTEKASIFLRQAYRKNWVLFIEPSNELKEVFSCVVCCQTMEATKDYAEAK